MASLGVGDLGAFLREQRRQAQLSLRQLADAAGVSNPYLSQIERGLRRPSAEILQQIAKALRISAETLYVQAGFLDERVQEEADADARVGVREAILADPGLNERQKEALLQIYVSFRSENARDQPAGEAPARDQPAGAGDERPRGRRRPRARDQHDD
ncbi:helix-turn-helix domain-containing protein [Streptomyces triticirhizae]|uniref:XRE family transcriptional regulator n=1 Tax=Streptomyces triticirhizae TaxID=2483353 RepID=A0A3M2LHM7_9ACTN|nr:helix-turn-helix transcriptional regulator [Streptomyces triticirhizae]RMI36982.1 XRE family transcriptional regulator [Streptomyces triticirhizae]